jgi:TolB-like protein
MNSGTLANTRNDQRFGPLAFVTELSRRKVCRALTTYCVALWLVCQVVEIITPAFGLPDWTVKFVIVLGIAGIPIALILSWLFDVTPEGLVRDDGENIKTSGDGRVVPRSKTDKAIDCGLLTVALIIGAQMALSGIGGNVEASTHIPERIIVMPFAVTSDVDRDSFAAALQIELQHELSRQASVTVVVLTDSAKDLQGSRLTGSVSIRGSQARVTTMMIDNRSGEVISSEAYLFAYEGADMAPAEIARDIATAMGAPRQAASEMENRHART